MMELLGYIAAGAVGLIVLSLLVLGYIFVFGESDDDWFDESGPT